jgi:Multiple antibiotic transporter
MLELIKAIGLGLVVLLPLANPLTTVALFLGLAGNMNSAERNHQSMMASVYVFAIMMVAYYAGQLVMNTFGISIPGLRIAGGLIVAFIGFRMLFPAQKAHGTWHQRNACASNDAGQHPVIRLHFVNAPGRCPVCMKPAFQMSAIRTVGAKGIHIAAAHLHAARVTAAGDAGQRCHDLDGREYWFSRAG